MSGINIRDFSGRVPRRSLKLMAPNQAQVATNCDLQRGKIAPFKALNQTAGLGSAVARTIYKHGDYWRKWAGYIDVVPSEIVESDNRIFYTGDGYPKQTNTTLAGTGTSIAASRRLGIVPPESPLTISLARISAEGGVASGATLSIDTDAYDEALDAAEEGETVSAISDGDTVTLGTKTYTFRTALTPAEGEVLIGGSVAAAFDNLKSAVNHEGTPGVDYHCMAAHPDIEATINRDSSQRFVARSPGEAGDNLATAVSGEFLLITSFTDGADYGDHFDTVSYYYTLVTEFGEESAPSPASAVIDVRNNEKVTLTGFTTAGATGSTITHYRVYRLSTGTDGAEYQLVPYYYDGDGQAVYDMPISSTSFVDADEDEMTLYQRLGETCPSEEWFQPPDDLEGLVQFQNGVLAGFVGKRVHVSEPLYPYAWPYDMTVAHDIVALGVFNNALIVATTSNPYMLRGNDPASLDQTVIDCEQACLSKRGLVSTNVGVIYPSPDGLVLINGLQWDLLTKNLYTREQWLALGPENLISFYYNDRYLGFFEGTGNGILINFKENQQVVDISLPAGRVVYGGFIDAEDDTLYLLTYAGGTFYIDAWDSHASSKLTADWRSSIASLNKYVNFACGMIVGDSGSVTFKLYADGVLKHTATVQTNAMFRLPSGFLYRECEVEIIGTTQVDIIMVGEAPNDVAG